MWREGRHVEPKIELNICKSSLHRRDPGIVHAWVFHETSSQYQVWKEGTTEAVLRRARIEGSWTFVSLDSKLESIKEEEERGDTFEKTRRKMWSEAGERG